MRGNLNLNKNNKNLNDKIVLYSIIGVSIIAVIIVALLVYSKKINDDVKNGTMTLEQMSDVLNETETESASTEMGKTVEEQTENNTSNQVVNNINTTDSNNASTGTDTNTNTSNVPTTNVVTKNDTKSTNTTTTNSEVEKKESNVELAFQKPVEGDIVKEYAQDNLVYSETLQEWVTHSGIDIKADKTTVVKSAEAGTVKSIKNDPRYGLTIVIEHANNFQTVYANLLTSEFVVEGEKVEKGQSIGTVGNTAVFEIADEPHLHFEILKDNIQVDPSIYLK